MELSCGRVGSETGGARRRPHSGVSVSKLLEVRSRVPGYASS